MSVIYLRMRNLSRKYSKNRVHKLSKIAYISINVLFDPTITVAFAHFAHLFSGNDFNHNIWNTSNKNYWLFFKKKKFFFI